MPVINSSGSRRNTSLPQKRGELRRQAMLAALEELLEETPLHEITTEQITERAGVVRSAFYFYFPTKYVAVATLLGDRFTSLRDWAWPLLTSSQNLFDRWRALLSWIVDEWTSQPRMFIALLDARNADSSVRELWGESRSLYVADLANFIEYERSHNNAPQGLPADALATALNALNERSLEIHLRRAGTADEAKQLIEVLTHVWVSSIYGTLQEEK